MKPETTLHVPVACGRRIGVGWLIVFSMCLAAALAADGDDAAARRIARAGPALERVGGHGPENLPALLALLEDRSGKMRRSAAAAIALDGPLPDRAGPQVTAALARLELNGVDATDIAAWGPAVVPGLIQRLSDRRRERETAWAAFTLGVIGDEARRAQPMVQRLLNEAERSRDEKEVAGVKVACRFALARWTGQAAHLQALVELIRPTWEPDDYRGPEPVQALRQLGPCPGSAVPGLWETAKAARDSGVRHVVLDVLITADARHLCDHLQRVLKSDPDREARKLAIGVLSRLGSPAVPVLAQLIDDRDEMVRSDAVAGLMTMGPQASEAVPAATRALRHPDPAIRLEAAALLATIAPQSDGARQAVPQLVAALRDDRHYRTAQKLLGAVGGREVVDHVAPLLIDAAADVKQRAITVLEATGGPGASALIQAAPGLDARGRSDVLRALQRMGPQAADAVPGLVRLLEHPEADTRIDVAKALGAVGWAASSATEALGRMQSDPDTRVAHAARAALRNIATPLHAAVERKDLAAATKMIDAGAPLDAVDDRGASVLHVAADQNDLAMVRLLVNRGARIDVPDAAGRTPLMAAARSGQAQVVRTLLAAGAGVKLADTRGRTALHEAVQSAQLDVCRLVLDAGADPNAADMRGTAPLHAAVQAWAGCSMRGQMMAVPVMPAGPGMTTPPASAAPMSPAGRGSPHAVHPASPPGSRQPRGASSVISPPPMPPPGPAGLTGTAAYQQDTDGAAQCREKQLTVVKLLLDSGADPNLNPGNTRAGEPWALAVPAALMLRDATLLRLLQSHGARVPDHMIRAATEAGAAAR